MSNDMASPRRIERRAFLKGAGAATVTALSIGFEWAGSTQRAQALAAPPGNGGTDYVDQAGAAQITSLLPGANMRQMQFGLHFRF